MPGTPTTRYGLAVMDGNDDIDTIDETNEQQMGQLDDIIASADQGTLALRPTSTGGTPGISGRFYYATDTAQLFFDHGTGWIEITGAAQGNLSARPAAGVVGRQYTDEFGTTWRDDGTVWRMLGGTTPHISLYRASNLSIPNSSGTDVTWDGTVEDDWSMHGPSTLERITIPYSGLWLIQFQAVFSANATGTRVADLVDHTFAPKTHVRGVSPVSASAEAVVSAARTRRFSAGDSVRLRVTQTSGGALNLLGGAAGDVGALTHLSLTMR